MLNPIYNKNNKGNRKEKKAAAAKKTVRTPASQAMTPLIKGENIQPIARTVPAQPKTNPRFLPA